MDTITTPHGPDGACPCERYYGVKAQRAGLSIAQTMAAQINARDREIARLKGEKRLILDGIREGVAAISAAYDQQEVRFYPRPTTIEEYEAVLALRERAAVLAAFDAALAAR